MKNAKRRTFLISSENISFFMKKEEMSSKKGMCGQEGVRRLDGAQGKKQVWRPDVRN